MDFDNDRDLDSMPSRYYAPGGAVPMLGTLMMQVLGLISAFVLAVIYAAVSHYNPYIFLNFIAMGIFGAGVGFTVYFGAKIGKVRNPMFIGVIGLVIGLAAMYFAWVYYLYFSILPIVIWDPRWIFEGMKAISEQGLWELFSWRPTGWALYGLWSIEALVVVLICLGAAASNTTPFCEYCNLWTKKKDDAASLGLTDFGVLTQELEAERYEVLDQLAKQPMIPTNCIKLAVHSCPNCEDSDYLDVIHSHLEVDSDGNKTTEEDVMIQNLRIPRELVEHFETFKYRAPALEQNLDDELNDEDDFIPKLN